MDPVLGRLSGRLRGLRRRTRIALAGVGVAALLVVGGTVSAAGAGGSAAVVPVTATSPPPSPSASPTPLLVQVVGAVRRPGVVSVAAGARVLDAIAAAGGLTAKADESAVDLAARVVDGQRVEVPERGAAPAAAATAGASGAPISLSTATADQLETLPRIGPAMAARILAYRQAHGAFTSVAELQQVSGIGPRTYDGLKDLVVP